VQAQMHYWVTAVSTLTLVQKDVIGTNIEYLSQDASNLLFSRPENQETQEE